MQLPSKYITPAATDLGRFLACRHLTGHDGNLLGEILAAEETAK